MTDRFIQFSSGFTAPQEIMDLVVGTGWHATGYDELTTFRVPFPAVFTPVYGVGPDDMFQMFEEASTGFSGALGRQVTISQVTVTGPDAAETEALLAALEAADDRRVVNLRGAALRAGAPITLAYESGNYRDADDPQAFALGRDEILAEAAAGTLLVTFTAWPNLYAGDDAGHPQPLLDVAAPGSGPTGDPDLPVLPADNPMTVRGLAIRKDAKLLVDGQPAAGSLSCVGGTFKPFCTSELIEIALDAPPTSAGLHMLQVVTNYGLLSNELPICVAPSGDPLTACR